MNESLLVLAIALLVRLSNLALALDAWCFDRAYSLGGVLVNQRRRIRSQVRRRR